MDEQESEQLLRIARKGDAIALDELLGQYRNYLSLLARLHIDRKLQAKLDDSDLVQETQLRAHRDFRQFRGATERELLEWLRKIMASTASNMVRHYYGTQRRDIRQERQLQADLDQSSMVLEQALVARGPSPSQRASRRERAVELANALQQLPKDYREVLVLHHLEGHAMPEVARRMGQSVDSTRKLWSRALIELRTVMQGPP